ncbi:MAG: UPF0280 family protein [Deltaproteobacteria bacterium]|nr:UPF0280 family protein [Candidatus Zymogenaceae bacterium]
MTGLFDNRTYRFGIPAEGLVSFTVTVKETNLFIRTNMPHKKLVVDAILSARYSLEKYIEDNPQFFETLSPLPDDPLAPSLVRGMIRDARLCAVGPMAAVAGTLAEIAARSLAEIQPDGEQSTEAIVENGGDVYIISPVSRVVSLEWSMDGGGEGCVGMEIPPSPDGIGISSSSGTFGHSLSLGGCDLAAVVASRGSLSDAAATALGNRIKRPEDIEAQIADICRIPDVVGAFVVACGVIGMQGDIRLTAVTER